MSCSALSVTDRRWRCGVVLRTAASLSRLARGLVGSSFCKLGGGARVEWSGPAALDKDDRTTGACTCTTKSEGWMDGSDDPWTRHSQTVLQIPTARDLPGERQVEECAASHCF